MKKNEVKVGGTYVAKVSDRIVTVRIDSIHSKGGWNATNTRTGKRIHIKSAQRLRGIAEPHGKQAETTKAAVAKDEKIEAPEVAEVTVTSDERSEVPGKATTEKAKPKKTADKQKPKRVGALDAAAQVLAKAEKPMGAKELIAAMAEQGLWTSPAGKTPWATLYAAIHREIAAKGDAARFKKVDRGLFESNT
jgi:hypothetical protein